MSTLFNIFWFLSRWKILGTRRLSTRRLRSRLHGCSRPALHDIEHSAEVVVNEANIVLRFRHATDHGWQLDELGPRGLCNRLRQATRVMQFAYNTIYLLLAHLFLKISDMSRCRVHASANLNRADRFHTEPLGKVDHIWVVAY